jgi:hypothetical protein
MQPSRRNSLLLVLALALWRLATPAHAASLQVFAVVYGQVTNDIAFIEQNFEGSSEQKLKLARLVAARNFILTPEFSDELALVKVIDVLAPEEHYDPLLDEVANNARAALLGRYDATGERLDLLPPSPRTTRARTRFQELTGDLAALNNAQRAAGIAAQLAPFGRALDATDELITRAAVLPRPQVHINGVRANINGKRFSGSGVGGSSPNIFSVTTPNPFYREVTCRVVDRERVITFTIPVLTQQARYDIDTGLVSLSYTPDVFEIGATPINAVSGTFWVQTVKDEIYGVFTASASGLEIKEGRFRIRLPKGP